MDVLDVGLEFYAPSTARQAGHLPSQLAPRAPPWLAEGVTGLAGLRCERFPSLLSTVHQLEPVLRLPRQDLPFLRVRD
ncbi:uncharacterized protein B0H18DRAFT_389704 [Fomitopsis serialis]|uniref:uncharacterized protein n=1 Tax=Fomitopsis serialis TaxID=139415 RepID=UPI0020079E3A|nr:uncharacterized protein B0H18DRAFT_389704 [Neoantrodia serialis]KAH9925176.1 hypothetical protein B0H18DRAFT_389704 [Neoantrodia serialis]